MNFINYFKDPYNPYVYYSVYTSPLIWFMGLYLGSYYYLLIPITVLLIFPILEILTGQNNKNPDESDYDKLQKDIRFNIPLWFWPLCQLLMIYLGLSKIIKGDLTHFEFIGLSISSGLAIGSIGFNVAHELIHRNDKFQKCLGHCLLASFLYVHFGIEHVFVHHKNVGLDTDWATAKKDENVYSFIRRILIPKYLTTWRVAYKFRLVHNLIIYHLMMFLYTLLVFKYAGFLGLLYVFIVAGISVFMMETVAYIEHYGLVRIKGEPISIHHSWNTDSTLTNFATFKLQRHSDHHLNSKRHYPNLKYYPEAPQLPTGYSGSMILAWIPPLWFKLMNSKFDK